MLGRLPLVLALSGALVLPLGAGCNTATLSDAPPPTGRGDDDVDWDDPYADAGADATSDAKRTNGDAATNPDPERPDGSPCPAPRKVTTANTPPGYLPPVKVTISRLIDGDSDDFNFPNVTKQGVRMLYINTEESGGEGVTPFGVKVKGIVHGWIRAAQTIEVAVRESSPGSGKPEADTYDRWLSLVFLDGELLQARIVREGLSAYYTLYGCAPDPVHEALLLGEAEANHAQRGIWSPNEEHNDYESVFRQWIGNRTCRPNPFKNQTYCP